MNNQNSTSQDRKTIARLVVIVLVLITLAQGPDLPMCHLLDLVTSAVEHTAILLPSLALSVCQGLHPAACEPLHISLCALGLLVWPLLATAA
jgi:hypothetical protein